MKPLLAYGTRMNSMTHQDAQRSYDNEEPEDYQIPDCGDVFDDGSDFVYMPIGKCPCCGQRKCVETQMEERDE